MTTGGDVVEVAANQTAPNTSISVEVALREVLRRSLIHDGLSRGLRECVKALDKKAAQLCVLAESCDEKEYVRLIEALCAQHHIGLIKIPDGKQLGEWTGLCKIDKAGNAQKVVSCSCAVIRDFGEESEYVNIILNQLRQQ